MGSHRPRFALAIGCALFAVQLASAASSDPKRGWAELGERLFFDKRLSRDGVTSCATCHQPEKAFTDGRSVAVGTNGLVGTRNTPTVVGATLQPSQFWDGRVDTVEALVSEPLFNPVEHGLTGEQELLALVNGNDSYRRVFGQLPDVSAADMPAIRKAFAAYISQVGTLSSPFDRYQAGEINALQPAARRGLELFRGRGQCATCHSASGDRPRFTDDKFHAAGVESARIAPRLPELVQVVAAVPPERVRELIARDADVAALGRFLITKSPQDIGAFRTPSLRNVALTAPYMHNGGIGTLEAAVDYELYYRSILVGRPLVMTPEERADIVAFLRSLTNGDFAEGNTK